MNFKLESSNYDIVQVSIQRYVLNAIHYYCHTSFLTPIERSDLQRVHLARSHFLHSKCPSDTAGLSSSLERRQLSGTSLEPASLLAK